MPKQMKVMFVAMLFGAAAAPLPAFAATGDVSTTPASVVAFDQSLKNQSIQVDYAYLPADGYVVVYKAGADGKPMGDPLGYKRAASGDHRQLSIELETKPAAGERLWVALYKDKDGTQSFDPNGGDMPIWSKTEIPAENMIVIR